MSEDATKLMICTWTKFFEDYDVVDVEKALMEAVRTNLTSFPPSAGMIVSNIPERRTGIRDYNDPREKLEREELTKALKRKEEWDKNRIKGDDEDE